MFTVCSKHPAVCVDVKVVRPTYFLGERTQIELVPNARSARIDKMNAVGREQAKFALPADSPLSKCANYVGKYAGRASSGAFGYLCWNTPKRLCFNIGFRFERAITRARICERTHRRLVFDWGREISRHLT